MKCIIYVLSPRVAVDRKLETDRNGPVKINVFLQKADNSISCSLCCMMASDTLPQMSHRYIFTVD